MLLIHLLNWEQDQESDIRRENFKEALIASHPENVRQILNIFREESNDEIEISDDEIEIEGFDITDIVKNISEYGGAYEDTGTFNAPA